MSKFKVGDRVKLVNPVELGRNFVGRTGVVEYIEKSDQDDLDYAVEFDEESPKFHDCFGHCVKNHGYWCSDEMIEPVEKKYYNGKIFVVKSNSLMFETGRIYEFVNGFTEVEGLKFPFIYPALKDFEAVKDYFGSGSYARVMEVKED